MKNCLLGKIFGIKIAIVFPGSYIASYG